MEAEGVEDHVRRLAAEAALGGDAELGDGLSGGRDPAFGAGDAVGQMEEAQVERRAGGEAQVAERGEVGVVGPIDRDG